ncbi:hypothetical protein INT45_009461 [Circinella minor]|uniref:Uncharacterized protein n=1 Tax=Circinella minor TaxID=1195481 RepID=A0A8H7S2M6_9FUNG|nr:hypothetical protein INT45_009461 [Circinella minor]
MGGLERDWARLSTLALPKLTYLHIKISDVTSTDFLRSHLPSMLHQYHSLETLALEGPYLHSSNTFTTDQGQDYHGVIADRTFNAIDKLPNLSSLHLSHFDIRSRAFRDLLNRHDNNNNSLARVFFPQSNQQQQQHNYHYHCPSPAHLLRELTFHHCIGVTLGSTKCF